MGYKDLDGGLFTKTTIKLGGFNKKTGKANPTRLEGYYRGTKKNIVTDLGVTCVHVFNTKDGAVGLWGSAGINYKMESAIVGLSTLIEYQGEQPSKKGSPMKVFRVRQDDTNIEVSDEPQAASSTQETSPADEEYVDDAEVTSEEELATDEVSYTPPVSAIRPASGPTPEQKAKVAAMLKARQQKSA